MISIARKTLFVSIAMTALLGFVLSAYFSSLIAIAFYVVFSLLMAPFGIFVENPRKVALMNGFHLGAVLFFVVSAVLDLK